MYISNSSNIGMATLLQNNKNCMKTLTTGTNVVGAASTAGSNHIIVGNVVTSAASHQVATASNVATTTSVGGGTTGGSITTLGSNLVLPAQTQTILLTNGATGASTIITYQQYQQLLQQQQQQQQQRLLVQQNLVNLPIGNLVSTANGGLAVITGAGDNNSSQHVTTNTSAASTNTHQGTFLVATNQQMQQHSSGGGGVVVTSSSYNMQPSQQQQRLITTTSNTVNGGGGQPATIRHFSQFSQQQQQPAVINTVNNQQQQQQQRTTVLINRNNNTIIAGNATQRLQHATILTTAGGGSKSSPATLIKTGTNSTNQQFLVNNLNSAAVQQVLSAAGKGQIINVVKKSTGNSLNNKHHIITKTATITANLPHKQQQQIHQRFGQNVQQIKQQQQQKQLKIVTTQNIPQRATILNNLSKTSTSTTVMNSNLTKNIITKPQTQSLALSSSSSPAFGNGGVVKAVPATSSAPTLMKTFKTPTSAHTSTATSTATSLTPSSSYTQQHQHLNHHSQQMNGHLLSNNFNKNQNNTINTTNSLQHQQQQQPASKLVPNGHIIHTATSSMNNNYNNTAKSTTLTSTVRNLQLLNTNPTSSSNTTNSSAHPTTTTSTFSPPNTNLSVANNSGTIANAATPITTSDSADNGAATNADTAAEQEQEPEIDIVINNVVCSFSVRCHLNLREIALNGANVEYRRENGMVTMKLRRPYTTASIWSSGRITCTGATSEEQAKIAARRYARCLGKLGFNVRFHNFRVVNVLGTCSMPWAIKIVNFSEKYREEASYEPELHPGVTYKLRFPKATLKIFSTGSVTVTAASVAHVQAAIEHIFPLVYEFRKKRSPEELEQLRLKKLQNATFDDIPDIITEDPELDILTKVASSATSVAGTTKRRVVSNAFSKTTNAKRKCTKLGGSDDEYDPDDPETILTHIIGPTGGVLGEGDDDDIVLYDPNESIIAGPDDDVDL